MLSARDSLTIVPAIVTFGLLGVLPYAGCAVIPWSDSAGYLGLVHDFRSSETPRVMLEQGREKRLYEATAAVYAYWWPLPLWPADGTMMGEYLFEHPLQ